MCVLVFVFSLFLIGNTRKMIDETWNCAKCETVKVKHLFLFFFFSFTVSVSSFLFLPISEIINSLCRYFLALLAKFDVVGTFPNGHTKLGPLSDEGHMRG